VTVNVHALVDCLHRRAVHPNRPSLRLHSN
jgi:hypothetical protein